MPLEVRPRAEHERVAFNRRAVTRSYPSPNREPRKRVRGGVNLSMVDGKRLASSGPRAVFDTQGRCRTGDLAPLGGRSSPLFGLTRVRYARREDCHGRLPGGMFFSTLMLRPWNRVGRPQIRIWTRRNRRQQRAGYNLRRVLATQVGRRLFARAASSWFIRLGNACHWSLVGSSALLDW
jgi:hypothetical protein